MAKIPKNPHFGPFFVNWEAKILKVRLKTLETIRPPWNLTILSIELGCGAENREIIKKNLKICLFSPKILQSPKIGPFPGREKNLFYFFDQGILSDIFSKAYIELAKKIARHPQARPTKIQISSKCPMIPSNLSNWDSSQTSYRTSF